MRYLIIILLFSVSVSGFAQSIDESECPTDFEGYLPPQLITGEQARVSLDFQLNLRPEPTLDQPRITALARGTQVAVISDPVCNDDFIWWQVETREGVIGWVAEGSLTDEEYFIEPRGELVLIAGADGELDRYIRTTTGFLEPEGCLRAPDDYDILQFGYAQLNVRTVFMLDNAQRIYDANGGEWAQFRNLITQGSYNAGGVVASFGTHDAGGAVDIAVRDVTNGFAIMREELLPMLEALRIAGFAAWVRETDELYDGSIIHIHAIAIGDAEASEIAQQQVDSEFGYLRGFNGLPPEEDADPIPDRYGDPIICEWMVDMGFDVPQEDEN